MNKSDQISESTYVLGTFIPGVAFTPHKRAVCKTLEFKCYCFQNVFTYNFKIHTEQTECKSILNRVGIDLDERKISKIRYLSILCFLFHK